MPRPRGWRAFRWFSQAALILLLSLSLPAAAQQADPAQGAQTPEAELDELIVVLEDPAAREQLVQQLKALREARSSSAEAPPMPVVEAAAAELFNGVSARLDELSATAFHVTAALNHLPEGWAWLQQQITEPDARRLWGSVLRTLALSLGIGYLAFVAFSLGLRRPARRLAARTSVGVFTRALLLAVLLLLRLAPIGGFAGAAYLTLMLTDPGETARLAALAWIAAVIIARSIQTLSLLLFAPGESALRVLPLDDESAAYADIWARRLNVTVVYGWFGLQTLRLLGLHEPTYLLLMNLLGVAVATLLMVLIAQNRAAAARAIRCPADESGVRPACVLRNRLAGVWHLLAGFYVLFLLGAWVLRLPGGFVFLGRATLLTLATAVLSWGLLFALKRLFRRTQRAGDELELRLPGLQRRANRYLPWVEWLFRWVIYALTLLAVLQVWGLGTLDWLVSDSGRAFGLTLARVLFLGLGALALWTFASAWLEGYVTGLDETVDARSARTKTLVQVASNALLVVVSVVAVLLILSELGIDIAPLLAGAGVVGLAVGFGAQTLVKDVITGIFILLQNHMAVGEVVKVGDTAGVVEALSIRHVRLRDLAGTVHTIPFSSISSISNLTKDFSYHVFNIGVAYRENVDEVMEAIAGVGAEMQQDGEYAPLILEPLEIFGLDAFGDSAVVIKGRIKTPPIKQWMVGREFNRRIKRRFDELGIEIPFPHRTLYFGVDKAGDAPAGRIRMQDERLAELAGESRHSV